MCVRRMIRLGRPLSLCAASTAASHAVERRVLAEVLDVPAVGLVALADVLGERQRGVALDRDVVVVVEDDQLAEAEVAGERRGLGRDALLEVAVGGDHVREVAEQLLAVAGDQHALAERHADRRGDALAERAGGRLDPRRVAVFRVAGAGRAELAEVLDVVERDAVPRQVQRRVQEHRRVPRRQHETVTSEPLRVGRRVAHDARVEQVRHGRQRHRRARVPRVGLLHRVHRQRPDRVDAQLVEGGALRRHGQCGSSPVWLPKATLPERYVLTLGRGTGEIAGLRRLSLNPPIPAVPRPRGRSPEPVGRDLSDPPRGCAADRL